MSARLADFKCQTGININSLTDNTIQAIVRTKERSDSETFH